MKKLDDEHCDMCKRKLDDDAGCIKMKINRSNSTTLYFVCDNCYDCVQQFIEDARNIGVENE